MKLTLPPVVKKPELKVLLVLQQQPSVLLEQQNSHHHGKGGIAFSIRNSNQITQNSEAQKHADL